MELHHSINLLKRILGTPGTSREPWAPPGPQKQPYLNKGTAPEAFDCCIRLRFLHRIAPRTSLDSFISSIKTLPKSDKCVWAHPMEEEVSSLRPKT